MKLQNQWKPAGLLPRSQHQLPNMVFLWGESGSEHSPPSNQLDLGPGSLETFFFANAYAQPTRKPTRKGGEQVWEIRWLVEDGPFIIFPPLSQYHCSWACVTPKTLTFRCIYGPGIWDLWTPLVQNTGSSLQIWSWNLRFVETSRSKH